MSNSPWGPPPPSDNPYSDQPRSDQPSGYPQQQPQQPGYPPPGHGEAYPPPGAHQGYGVPGPGAPGRDPEKRPGTVTAAAVITFVCAGLGALLFALASVALLVASESVAEEIRREIEGDPAFDGATLPSVDDLSAIFVVVMLVLLLWCLVACGLAVLAMRRSNVGRVLLVVSAAVSALLSLLAILSGVSLVPLVASVAVIVLLFTGGAGDWYARRPH